MKHAILRVSHLLTFFLVGAPAASLEAAMPPAGMYVSPQYQTAEIEALIDVHYGLKTNQAGISAPLLLDVFVPPGARVAPRPLVVVIHGGGFRSGSKAQFRDLATAYASCGFVAASIGYRLTPGDLRDAAPENFITAATHAVEDGMDAIRFLKSHAATYGIDAERIATLGSSAGGWFSVINALDCDTFPGTQTSFPGTSSRVAAAVATGVSFADNDTCKRVRGMLTFDASDTPLLLFHAEGVDKVTNAPWSEAIELATRIRASANRVELHPQPGNTHVIPLNPEGDYWGVIAPFLWRELALDQE